MSTPRYTYTTVNGVKILDSEEWFLEGQNHRIDGPALRQWEVVDGRPILTLEGWYLNGQRHRIDGSAWREWDVLTESGEVVLTYEEWYLNGKRHRTDGPAWQEWDVVDGLAVLFCEEWHLKGTKIHPRILRQPVRVIERWWLFQQSRRQEAIQSLLWDSGMTVFPGFMGLLREY